MAQRGRKKGSKNKVKTVQVKAKKQEKSLIEPDYLKIKEYFKSKKYDSKILNEMCMNLIEKLGELTSRGITRIEGLPMDTWKMRVWVIVEKAGLLPEYKSTDEDELFEDEEPLINSDDEDWYGGEVDDFDYITNNLY